MKAVLYLLMMTFSANVLAGGMDSGGGLGLVCFKSVAVAKSVKDNNGYIDNDQLADISFLQTLDLYEALLKKGMDQRVPKIMEPKPDDDFGSFLETALFGIEKSFPKLGESIRSAQSDFSGNNVYWQEIGLISISDSNGVANYNTKLCSLTTLALQFKEEDSHYLNIDPRLFFHEKMSVQSQSVLLLHEYIYLLTRKKGSTNSRSTRLAIALLLSDDGVTKITKIAQSLMDLGFMTSSEVKEILWGEEVYPRNY